MNSHRVKCFGAKCRSEHSWQWAQGWFCLALISEISSLPGVYHVIFFAKALGSGGFHGDFNRPLITLWDQRDSSSFVLCCTKWISGRLKITPNRVPSCSIADFCATDTLHNECIIIFTPLRNYTPTHCQGYTMSYFLPKHLALGDFMTISIVR